MGFVEKFKEIEKSQDELCEQLRNKIDFIHENVGKDYRTDDSWYDNGYTILTEVSEEGEFVIVSYECFRHYDETNRLYIKKELLDMSEEEILKNKDDLKTELEAYNEEQLRQLKEIKKEKELEVKKREYERLMALIRQEN
jgi:hypothetical protein